jgi:hypothetical protein
MKSLPTALLAASVMVALLAVIVSTSVYGRASDGATPPLQAQPHLAVPDGFTFAAGGDLIGPYRGFDVDTTPGIPPIAELFRHSDLGFANQEGAIFDSASFHGSAAAENGGGTPIYSPQVAKDLRSMGITIVQGQ